MIPDGKTKIPHAVVMPKKLSECIFVVSYKPITSIYNGHGNPLQYSCLEDPHGQRSLVGYSPWGAMSRTQLLD